MSMKYLGETFDIHLGGEDLVFPHHENEIAQSEALTGTTFARFWMHVRFLLVEGEKMSKSLGNFFTLRDLVCMGHKPSSIRFLLASVPYRKQLNFTFDGLTQAANSVERLRNFNLRLETEQFPEGESDVMRGLASSTILAMSSGLNDDLNTAQALGAIFDMVREANAAADAGHLHKGDVAPLLDALHRFDEVFGVLPDDDAAKMARIVEWAEREGYGSITLTTFSDVPWNMPFYERLGFRVISPTELSRALRSVLNDEARRGLDPARRVAMRRELGV
jgi:cysteinyl-tRNA synthetase